MAKTPKSTKIRSPSKISPKSESRKKELEKTGGSPKKRKTSEDSKPVAGEGSPKSPKKKKSEVEETPQRKGSALSIGVRFDSGKTLPPPLVSGIISHFRAVLQGSKIYAPCGAFAQVFSVKSSRAIGTLGPHGGRVTAVCAGPRELQIVTGAESGELRIWDRGSQQLSQLQMGSPVLDVHWPEPQRLVVTLGRRGGEAWVEEVSAVADAPTKSRSLPLRAVEAGPCDAFDDMVVLADGKDVLLWAEGWSSSQRYSHDRLITAVAIDPLRRYVAAGDAAGAVWFWWNAPDGLEQQRISPGRSHWHASAVQALAHSGPLLLSGGEEGVLVMTNPEEDTRNFIPRFPAAFRHLTVPPDGGTILCCLQDNSIALVDSLHGIVRPRKLYAIDYSLSEPLARERKRPLEKQKGVRKRAKVQPEARLLHSLAGGSVVACRGSRLTFFNGFREPEPADTSVLKRTNANTDPKRRWVLQRLVVSCNGSCIMTCESRVCPALEAIDASAVSTVCKWWRQSSGEYLLDSVSNNPHADDVTAAFGHPEEDGIFCTASRDRTFKIWEDLEAPGVSRKCWQCTAAGQWSQSMVSGCFSPDGSVLAAGLVGCIVFWKVEDGEVSMMNQVALEEKTDVPKQMCSVTTTAFLHIACVAGKQRDEILCWDLYTLQVVAKLDLRAALPGRGAFEMRCSMLQPYQILAFRSGEVAFSTWNLEEAEEQEDAPMEKEGQEEGEGEEEEKDDEKDDEKEDEKEKEDKKEKEDEKDDAMNLEKPSRWSFVQKVSATLPDDHGLEDMAFQFEENSPDSAEYSLRQSVLCWTAKGQLWNVDLAGEQTALAAPEEEVLAEKPVSALGQLAGGRLVGKSAAEYPLRVTPAQQAGLVPRYLQRVLPPQVPSHMLPAPAALWEEFVKVFAKPLESASPVQAPKPSAKADAAASTLPESRAVTMVDQEWMDALVEAM